MSTRLNSVFTGFYSNEAWACGNNGTVLRTSNLGTNWLNVSGNGIPSDAVLVSIVRGATSTLTCGNRGDTAFVYRSTNQGQSWTQVFRQNGGRLNAISKFGNINIFLQGNPVGGRWSIWKSTNDGATWDSAGMRLMQAGSETSANNSIASGNNSMLFGTNNARLYYTTNAGPSWRTLLTPLEPSPTAIDIQYFADTTFSAYVGGTNRILTTTNAGYSWDTVYALPGGTGLIGSITLRGIPVEALVEWAQTIYVRNDNKIYKKWPWAQWYIEYTAPSGNYTYTSKSYSGSVWAVRDNGGISYCSCPLSGLENNNNKLPDRFMLYQNYPNPFNPVTMIKFNIAFVGAIHELPVRLQVFDLLGKEIAVLVDKQLLPGTYSVDWDASAYPSGVYYYKLVSGDYSETKKMVLIK